jgi:magnesium-transporting ATPase (P-type)
MYLFTYLFIYSSCAAYLFTVYNLCNYLSLMYSLKYNQQDATLYNILYYCLIVTALHVSDRETAQNMYSSDNNKEYCITLQLVGCT